MPYYYYAFGLNIESEIKCPLLTAAGSTPDLVIRLGQVPHELKQAQVRESFYQVNARHCLLNFDKAARYLVSDGNQIIVEPHPAASEEEVRLFLLGSAMGALLHQRGIWPLHGSAVSSGSGAVLFVGARGIGKSTLAGAFHQRGFQPVSDDVCAITAANDGIIQVWPSIPRIRLWTDSLTKLGGDPQQLGRTRSVQQKYELPLQQFGREPAAVQVVYVLHTADGQEAVSLKPLEGFDKIQALTSNTYRLSLLAGMQLSSQHFQQAQALARQARVVRVTRPPQPFLLDELAGIIEKDMVQ